MQQNKKFFRKDSGDSMIASENVLSVLNALP